MGASGSEGHLRRLQIAGLLCWLAKDFAWVLLLPEASFPAAFLALCLETYSIRARWSVGSTPEFVMSLAVLAWLAGNSVWMASELLFAASPEPGRQFPWFHTPVIGIQPDTCFALVKVTQCLFALGVSMPVVLFCWSVIQHWGKPPTGPADPPETEARKLDEAAEIAVENAQGCRSDLVMGLFSKSVYEDLFIGPWVAKDLFWTLGWLSCALPFGLAAALLTLDCFRRFGGVLNFAEFVWIIANIVWILAELALDDQYRWPRVTAGAILLADGLLVSGALWAACQRRRPGQGEDSYLFGGGSYSGHSLQD